MALQIENSSADKPWPKPHPQVKIGLVWVTDEYGATAELLLVWEKWRTSQKILLWLPQISQNPTQSWTKDSRVKSHHLISCCFGLLLFIEVFKQFMTLISIHYNLQLSADLGMDQMCNWRDLVPASHQVFHHTLLMLCLESGLDMILVQSFQMVYAPTTIHVRSCGDNHHTQLPIENNRMGNECIT